MLFFFFFTTKALYLSLICSGHLCACAFACMKEMFANLNFCFFAVIACTSVCCMSLTCRNIWENKSDQKKTIWDAIIMFVTRFLSSTSAFSMFAYFMFCGVFNCCCCCCFNFSVVPGVSKWLFFIHRIDYSLKNYNAHNLVFSSSNVTLISLKVRLRDGQRKW